MSINLDPDFPLSSDVDPVRLGDDFDLTFQMSSDNGRTKATITYSIADKWRVAFDIDGHAVKSFEIPPVGVSGISRPYSKTVRLMSSSGTDDPDGGLTITAVADEDGDASSFRTSVRVTIR
jgi:hypothetical protein